MSLPNIEPLPHQEVHIQESLDQEQSRAAELAWEYCGKQRRGENPSKDDFYLQLEDQRAKIEFDFLIGINEFIEHAVEHQIQSVE